jgi:subtilisin-like proprotein convertase family protein
MKNKLTYIKLSFLLICSLFISGTALAQLEILADTSFEAGSPNPSWTETSTNFGTPLCTVALCTNGTGTGPHTGTWWSWFGGIGTALEESSLTQTVTIPVSTAANLTFYLEQIVCDDPADFLDVVIDGTDTVFHTDGSSALCGVLGYSLQTVPMTAYADGNSHTVQFHSITFGTNGTPTNIFVDDVSLIVDTTSAGAPCDTTISFNPALAIPDNDLLGVADSEVVSTAPGTILGTDVKVTSVCFAITHTYVGDLSVILTAPNGTQITLMDQPGVPASTFGCAGDDVNACVILGTGNEMENVCGNLPAISGSYTAANATDLNAINIAGGSPNGTWTLSVTDAAAGDTGTVDSWSLTFDTGPSATWTQPASYTLCSAAPINLDLLITGTAGGTWSGTGVTGNMFDPAGLYGNIPVTYTVTAGSCTSTQTHSFLVYCSFENYGWVSKPDIPTGTFGLAGAFWLNGNSGSSPGQLFAFGGADFTAIQAYNNSFSTVANTWSTMTAMPTAKYQFSAQRVGDKIYCAGGYSTGFVPDTNTYIYDVINNTWANGALMPTPVGDYASGVYMDSLIYYIGGYSGADENIVQIYNTFTDTWTTGTTKLGTAAGGLRGGINGNKIVTVGGYNQTLASELDEAYLGDIDPIDPTQITWTALPAYPGGTVGRLAAGVPYGNQHPLIIFVGGDPSGTGTAAIDKCWGYDIIDNQWKFGPPKITAVSNISDFAGVVYNDSLWMASVSGYDGAALTTVHEWLNLGSFIPLSVAQNSAVNNSGVNIYPNPAGDYLSISVKDRNTLISTVEIMDVTGRKVLNASFDKKENVYSINVKNLTKGIYFVEINSVEGKQLAAKFAKQ